MYMNTYITDVTDDSECVHPKSALIADTVSTTGYK